MSRPRKRRGFGSIVKRGKTYQIRFRKDGADIRRGGFRTEQAAESELQRIGREIERHELLGVRPIGEETVGEFWQKFRKRIARRRAASTAAMDEIRWDGVFASAWGHRTLKDITREHVEAWIADRHHGTAFGPGGRRLRPVGPSTTNRDLAFLSVLFREAVRASLMRENPVTGIERAKEQERPDQYLSPEDVNRLVGSSRSVGYGEVLAPYIRLLADTGLRRGELERLQWQDIDDARSVLVVRRSKNYSTRSVPLTEAAQDALNELKLLRDARDPDVVPLERHGLTAAMVRGRFKKAATAAGLSDSLRIHDLRHAFGAQMAAAGVPLPHLKTLMGHKSIATTMRYARHAPDDAGRTAVRRFEEARNPAHGDPRRTSPSPPFPDAIGHTGGHTPR